MCHVISTLCSSLWQKCCLQFENQNKQNCQQSKIGIKLIPGVTHLNAGEIKMLEGTHRTELIGGEMGLEKHTKNEIKF